MGRCFDLEQGMDLFEHQDSQDKSRAPLAERLRPSQWDGFLGQRKAVGPQTPLIRSFLKEGYLPSLILWGPPGTGKTTFARLIAQKVRGSMKTVNAIDTGAKELRRIGEEYRRKKLETGERFFLFVDEIHRFNKSQQDVLLPFVERGDFVLIGATTENPSYELNSALISRCRILVFETLGFEELDELLQRACVEFQVDKKDILSEEARHLLIEMASGDARTLLNVLEQILEAHRLDQKGDNLEEWPLGRDRLEEFIESSTLFYDKAGDTHYDTISAFIKSVRGSDPDAALYYLATMLEGGEDPVFVARRLVILASEDIGNADPRAITVAVSGLQAVELVGMPEATISLAQVTTYLSSAPKSNRSYLGIKKAQELVQKKGQLPVPLALRSGRTSLLKSMGYGKGYKYSHDGPTGYVEQEFLPEEISGTKFYEPSNRGFEKNIRQYLSWMKGQGGKNSE